MAESSLDKTIEALEFYANRYTWDSTKQRTNITAADVDRGERARDALTALRAPVAVDYWVMGKGVYIAPKSKRHEDAVLICECATVEQCHAVKDRLLATPPPAAGGMKAADAPYKYDMKAFQEAGEAIVDFRSRNGVGWSWEALQVFAHTYEQHRALATQPEARPLRELIAEGCECVWLWLPISKNWLIMNDLQCVTSEDLLSRPAIAILKPTVTP